MIYFTDSEILDWIAKNGAGVRRARESRRNLMVWQYYIGCGEEDDGQRLRKEASRRMKLELDKAHADTTEPSL